MSTVIHDGYRMPMTDLFGLVEFFDTFRDKAWPLFYKRRAEIIMDRVVHDIDLAALPDAKIAVDDYVVGEIASDVDERIRKSFDSLKRNPPYDLQCELVAFPHKRTNRIYLMLITEYRGYRDLLKSLSGVELFDYDSRVMSKREQGNRGNIWEEVLGESMTPLHNGISRTLLPNYFNHVTAEELREHLPTFEQRVQKRAYDRALTLYIREQTAKSEKEGGDTDPFHHFFDAERWLKTDEGQGLLSEQREWLRGILDPLAIDHALQIFEDHMAKRRR